MPVRQRIAKSELKGAVKKVIDIDIDKAFLGNTDLDQAVIIEGSQWRFPDNFFDLAWAAYVLDHIEKPAPFLHELHRVLKPGASFFFRTRNKHHYLSMVGRFTPHSFHELITNRVRGLVTAHEPYRTYYRLNGRKEY